MIIRVAQDCNWRINRLPNLAGQCDVSTLAAAAEDDGVDDYLPCAKRSNSPREVDGTWPSRLILPWNENPLSLENACPLSADDNNSVGTYDLNNPNDDQGVFHCTLACRHFRMPPATIRSAYAIS